MIATSGQAKVAYDVTGGGNDDRPPVSLVRGPITVCRPSCGCHERRADHPPSARLLGATSTRYAAARSAAGLPAGSAGTRPAGWPAGSAGTRPAGWPAGCSGCQRVTVSPVGFPPSGDRLASQLVSSEQSSRTNGGGELHRAERQGKLTRGGRWRHRNAVVESPAYRSAASS